MGPDHPRVGGHSVVGVHTARALVGELPRVVWRTVGWSAPAVAWKGETKGRESGCAGREQGVEPVHGH